MADPAPGPEREPDEDVRKILDAAWAALSRAGYDNLKVQSVIRAAGVSTGSFYRRFADKQQLMLALLTEEARRNTRWLETRTSSGTPTERIVAWVDAAAGMAFHERSHARTRWFSALPAEILEELVLSSRNDPTADTTASLRRAIAAGVESGDFPHAQPGPDAAAIQGLCNRVATGKHQSFGSSREEVLANVTRFVLAALTNPAGASPPPGP